MKIAVDGHVHFYPCYDIPSGFRALMLNLDELDFSVEPGQAAAVKVALLTEAKGHAFFERLGKGELAESVFDFRISGVIEDAAVAVRDRNENTLFVIAGRQIVSRERVEILALTVDVQGLDGLSVPDIIERIRAAGGVPVLSWAPGKWFFGRGRVVRHAIDSASPGGLLIGDTSLRPTIWGEPLPMRRARKRGLRIIAGSDPLPFSGEEAVMGAYGFVCDAVFDAQKPVASIRRILSSDSIPLRVAGCRGNAVATFVRLMKNRTMAKQKPIRSGK